jgi:hypothetical protein
LYGTDDEEVHGGDEDDEVDDRGDEPAEIHERLRMAGACCGASNSMYLVSIRRRSKVDAEAFGCLVAPPVFKTGERRTAALAGSIPVRLR